MTGRSLAMVYSPCQEFEGLYEPMAGLLAGTVFRELEKPFYGARRLK
ncbi:MAG: spore coat associated protein CotJA [Clostridia bacterium]|nr:spore coat associated protein CotJA [Clostridia bacterium]